MYRQAEQCSVLGHGGFDNIFKEKHIFSFHGGGFKTCLSGLSAKFGIYLFWRKYFPNDFLQILNQNETKIVLFRRTSLNQLVFASVLTMNISLVVYF
jgi:hypothetical protein